MAPISGSRFVCRVALIGMISVRTAGIYTIMITIAIAMAFFYLAQQNYSLFNGHSGFASVLPPHVFGLDWRAPNSLPRTAAASSLRPRATKKRGLSGINSSVMKNTVAGMICAQNIQRQAA